MNAFGQKPSIAPKAAQSQNRSDGNTVQGSLPTAQFPQYDPLDYSMAYPDTEICVKRLISGHWLVRFIHRCDEYPKREKEQPFEDYYVV